MSICFWADNLATVVEISENQKQNRPTRFMLLFFFISFSTHIFQVYLLFNVKNVLSALFPHLFDLMDVCCSDSLEFIYAIIIIFYAEKNSVFWHVMFAFVCIKNSREWNLVFDFLRKSD